MKDRMMLRELEGEKLELEHKHKLELIAKGGDKQGIAGDRFKGPKLPPFEEKSDDIDSYLRRFERHEAIPDISIHLLKNLTNLTANC
jgi:hypothetical protein